MSNPPVPPQGPGQPPLSKKDAKAQAAADKAYAKSQRSWFANHKILTALGAIILFGILISALNGGGSDTPDTAGSPVSPQQSASSPAANPQEPAAKMAGVNTPVRDGKFEFTVTGMKCGVASVGADVVAEKAQGQFCLVTMKVSNIGDEAQYLDGSSQYAFDAAGKKYSSSSAASVVLKDAQTFLNQINPGNSVNGTVVFDVPKTAKIDHLELHDSPFSDGVSVKVG